MKKIMNGLHKAVKKNIEEYVPGVKWPEIICCHWGGRGIKRYRRKNRKREFVYVDAWDHKTRETKVKEEDLLTGELEAVIFKVGCYFVRSAQRAYKIHDSFYNPETEEPASDKDLDRIRNERLEPDRTSLSWWSELRIVHEISARHKNNPDAKWISVCRAATARNYSWSEYIGDIYAVKENIFVSNNRASLLVYTHYEGSSFGVDTWYKLEPNGKVKTLTLHPYDSDMKNAEFV